MDAFFYCAHDSFNQCTFFKVLSDVASLMRVWSKQKVFLLKVE